MKFRGDFKGIDEIVGRKKVQDSPLSAEMDGGRLCLGFWG